MAARLDALIAGQGLAGSLLAYRMHSLGLEIRIADPGTEGSASRAAAGILSPFTGPRYQAPMRLAALLDEAERAYAELAAVTGHRLFRPMPVWRLLQDDGERQRIARRHAEHPDLIPPQPVPGREAPPGTRAPLGAVPMHGGGHVDLGHLLDGLRRWFSNQGLLIDERLGPESVALPSGEPAQWHGVTARHVIFCEGAGAFTNPWWQSLPWRRSRGETLTLRCEQPGDLPQAIVTGGESLVPLGGDRYRLGATYERGAEAGRPTAEAREKLLAALPRLLEAPPAVHVEAGHAGLRPGSRPGPPFIGLHPQDPRIGIANGFGSRGTLLAPWYTRRLADHLALGAPLPREADVRQRTDLQ